jgi:acetyl-CoA carboxylase biotin carboxyl carrier protein
MSKSVPPKANPAQATPDYIIKLDELAQWLEGSAMAEVEIEHEGLKLRLKKPGVEGVYAAAPAPIAAAPAVPVAAPEAPANTFNSPLVGTFFAASSPEAAPFVTVGARVEVGQVLGIIEAMKTMNQLTAESAGTVQKILVKNGSPVEFGQPLFVIA